MRKEGNNMSEKGKKVGLIALAAAIMAASVGASIAIGKAVDGRRAPNSSDGGASSVEERKIRADVGTMSVSLKESGIVVKDVSYAVNDVGNTVASFSYKVIPTTTANQAVLVETVWADGDAAGATETAAGYVEATVDEASGTGSITKKMDFGKRIEVIVRSQDNQNKYAAITLDSIRGFKGFKAIDESLPYSDRQEKGGRYLWGDPFPASGGEYAFKSIVAGFSDVYTIDRKYTFTYSRTFDADARFVAHVSKDAEVEIKTKASGEYQRFQTVRRVVSGFNGVKDKFGAAVGDVSQGVSKEDADSWETVVSSYLSSPSVTKDDLQTMKEAAADSFADGSSYTVGLVSSGTISVACSDGKTFSQRVTQYMPLWDLSRLLPS